jgi:anaerobic ribonucleoside-triphosphate reductase activating protein
MRAIISLVKKNICSLNGTFRRLFRICVMDKVPQEYVNMAAFTASTRTLGPGNRAAIWVRGCPFNCQGCLAPGWRSSQPARLIPVQELAAWIAADNSIDGLTISGGEPMQQAKQLSQVIRLSHTCKELTVIVFTGYKYAALRRMPETSGVPEFLSLIDLLVDGQYEDSWNDDKGLRGSVNQRIIPLTSRLKGFDFENHPRNVDIFVSDQAINYIGIPTRELKTLLDKIFFQTGVKIRQPYERL